MSKNIHVILAPDLESAKAYTEKNNVEATVEAEYGDVCVEGTMITLAHHGSRSGNPAPCNTPDVARLKSGTILVSHLDLDALGGILDIMGMKPRDDAFWQAAELIDVKGLHHIHELSQNVQDQLNAYYAWNAKQERVRYSETTDITDTVFHYYSAIKVILDPDDPSFEAFIREGQEWNETITASVESKLVKESIYTRCFITDRVFCSAAYYSPNLERIVPSTVVMNTGNSSITVAFADGGKYLKAVDIVQELWGSEAGGRAGIAGSPRNWELSREQLEKEFEKCSYYVEDLVKNL